MYRTGVGIGGGSLGLAATGFASLLYAELALVVIAAGLFLLRIARVRRAR